MDHARPSDADAPCDRTAWMLAARYSIATQRRDRSMAKRLRHQLLDYTVALPASACRAELERAFVLTPAEDLPHTTAIYLITAPDGSAYVGCTVDVHDRFLGRFGHMNSGGTRADSVLALPGVQIAISVIDPIASASARRRRLGALEAYYFLIARGAGMSMTNAVGSLAAQPDAVSAAVVSVRLADGHLELHESARSASVSTGASMSALPAALYGWQAQAHGHAFRPATPAEAALGAPCAAGSDATYDGRNLAWSQGDIRTDVRNRLLQRSRGGRYDKSRSSGFYGVVATPGKDTWTAYYVHDPADRSSPRKIGSAYATPRSAARARDRFLRANPQFAPYNRSGPKRR